MNLDNTNKRILARGCDPIASRHAAQVFPPLLGNPEYVATTDDNDFIEKLTHETWSVIFFAPGACRFSAAKSPIPGGNQDTLNWDLDDYTTLVRQSQGKDIQIVESQFEQESIPRLKAALAAIN